MDLLKRTLAPITDEAWKEIEDEAKTTLKGNLSGRRLVDFCGPNGWEMSAVNSGTMKVLENSPVEGAQCALRVVQPLVEIRVPFSLNMWDLDNISRGSKTADLDPVADAARQAAMFEEVVLYKGYQEANIKGLLEVSEHESITIDMSSEKIAYGVEEAVVTLQKAGVQGAYALVLGTDPYKEIMASDKSGYPIKKRLNDILGGGIHWSPALSGGILLSRRGGDFELCVGQDLSIGYESHNSETIKLFITESFTFRVLQPEAVVALNVQAQS